MKNRGPQERRSALRLRLPARDAFEQLHSVGGACILSGGEN
jgi:hypothetical protein